MYKTEQTWSGWWTRWPFNKHFLARWHFNVSFGEKLTCFLHPIMWWKTEISKYFLRYFFNFTFFFLFFSTLHLCFPSYWIFECITYCGLWFSDVFINLSPFPLVMFSFWLRFLWSAMNAHPIRMSRYPNFCDFPQRK